MSKAFKRAILAISVLLVIVVFLGGFGLSGVRAGTQNDGAYRQMGVYEEVLHKIQSDYVVEPSITNVTSGALHGLLVARVSPAGDVGRGDRFHQRRFERRVFELAQIAIEIDRHIALYQRIQPLLLLLQQLERALHPDALKPHFIARP